MTVPRMIFLENVKLLKAVDMPGVNLTVYSTVMIMKCVVFMRKKKNEDEPHSLMKRRILMVYINSIFTDESITSYWLVDGFSGPGDHFTNAINLPAIPGYDTIGMRKEFDDMEDDPLHGTPLFSNSYNPNQVLLGSPVCIIMQAAVATHSRSIEKAIFLFNELEHDKVIHLQEILNQEKRVFPSNFYFRVFEGAFSTQTEIPHVLQGFINDKEYPELDEYSQMFNIQPKPKKIFFCSC